MTAPDAVFFLRGPAGHNTRLFHILEVKPKDRVGRMIKISELQSKDVVNVSDGRKLGQIYDLEVDLRLGKVKALMIPGESRMFGLFTGGKEWVIPWNQIIRIGADVILVRLETQRDFSEETSDSRPLLTNPDALNR